MNNDQKQQTDKLAFSELQLLEKIVADKVTVATKSLPPNQLTWRNIFVQEPNDGERCLTKCKHGIIEGEYDKTDGVFCSYYWRDMVWSASEYIPLSEIQEGIDNK